MTFNNATINNEKAIFLSLQLYIKFPGQKIENEIEQAISKNK